MVNYVEISKEFTVDIAHVIHTQQLPDKYFPKCKYIHGHTVVIKPIIIGTINEKTRMVYDYTLLNNFKKVIDTFFDHKFLLPYKLASLGEVIVSIHNQVVGVNYKNSQFTNPKGEVLLETNGTITYISKPSTTAEDMVTLLVDILATTIWNAHVNNNVKIEQIKLLNIEFKETPKSSCKLYQPIDFQTWLKHNGA